jgi:hypothetical protein
VKIQLRSYLEEKVAAPVQRSEITTVRIRHADQVAPSIRKFDIVLADKRRSLGWHTLLADSGHGVLFFCKSENRDSLDLVNQ